MINFKLVCAIICNSTQTFSFNSKGKRNLKGFSPIYLFEICFEDLLIISVTEVLKMVGNNI